eukprot:Awhi_evm1s1800
MYGLSGKATTIDYTSGFAPSPVPTRAALTSSPTGSRTAIASWSTPATSSCPAVASSSRPVVSSPRVPSRTTFAPVLDNSSTTLEKTTFDTEDRVVDEEALGLVTDNNTNHEKKIKEKNNQTDKKKNNQNDMKKNRNGVVDDNKHDSNSKNINDSKNKNDIKLSKNSPLSTIDANNEVTLAHSNSIKATPVEITYKQQPLDLISNSGSVIRRQSKNKSPSRRPSRGSSIKRNNSGKVANFKSSPSLLMNNGDRSNVNVVLIKRNYDHSSFCERRPSRVRMAKKPHFHYVETDNRDGNQRSGRITSVSLTSLRNVNDVDINNTNAFNNNNNSVKSNNNNSVKSNNNNNNNDNNNNNNNNNNNENSNNNINNCDNNSDNKLDKESSSPIDVFDTRSRGPLRTASFVVRNTLRRMRSSSSLSIDYLDDSETDGDNVINTNHLNAERADSLRLRRINSDGLINSTTTTRRHNSFLQKKATSYSNMEKSSTSVKQSVLKSNSASTAPTPPTEPTLAQARSRGRYDFGEQLVREKSINKPKRLKALEKSDNSNDFRIVQNIDEKVQ